MKKIDILQQNTCLSEYKSKLMPNQTKWEITDKLKIF